MHADNNQTDAETYDGYLKGRGAQFNPANKFLQTSREIMHWEAVDELPPATVPTQVFVEHGKTIVNKVDSPDVGMLYSLNPYQGCEHGCIYCYARNAHEYWGFSAGLDFESKIVVKEDAPELLRKFFQNKNWKPYPIALSGNTDCYQPLERKHQITRKLLQVFLEHRNPVGMITKNALILRDLDILRPLAQRNLVHVAITVTSLTESLRQKMEPRTAAYKKRLGVIRQLTDAGIPTTVMVAPIIPGLNSHEISDVVKAAADAGAVGAGYTVVRLNGAIGPIFRDWIHKAFPDRATRVLHQIEQCHGGHINDSRWGTRMVGDGPVAESIRQLFTVAVQKHMGGRRSVPFNVSDFRRDPTAMELF
jgi:DNA repair photolyase